MGVANDACAHILALALKQTGVLVGRADFLEEHEDGYPWLGVLLLDTAYRGQGLGAEAFARLAEYFRARYGWSRLRLGVRLTNEGALAFWRGMSFEPIPGNDECTREFVTLERAL